MPELPDLEVYRRNMRPRLCGQTLTEVVVHKDKRLNVTPELLITSLQGATLKEIQREGKELHFLLSNGHTLALHLMLKGQFCIVPTAEAVKYAVLTLGFDTGEKLVACDSFGWTTVTLDPAPVTVLDALSETLTLDYLAKQLQASRGMNMKLFLLDQAKLGGIGNAYADEILWACRIAPESRCERLPEAAVQALHTAIHDVLTDAITQIDILRPGLLGGEIRDHLKIYGKKLCPNGCVVHCKELSTRKTYFTDEQTLYL